MDGEAHGLLSLGSCGLGRAHGERRASGHQGAAASGNCPCLSASLHIPRMTPSSCSGGLGGTHTLQ